MNKSKRFLTKRNWLWNHPNTVLIGTPLLAIVLALVAISASAEVRVGATYNVYNNERIRSTEGLRLELATDSAYVWGSYEKPGFDMMGQTFNDIEMWCAGIGYRVRSNKVWAAIDGGYCKPEVDPLPAIQLEATYAQLRQNHGVPPFVPNQSSYDLQSSIAVAARVGFRVNEFVDITLGYRALSFEEGYDVWVGDERTLECNCWWQERTNLDAGGWELGIQARF